MLEELPRPVRGLRKLNINEKKILVKMGGAVKELSNIEKILEPLLVCRMNDGGMGSIKFFYQDESEFGSCVADAECFDEDGVLVSLNLNLDTHGRLYELDIWKTDFSPLIRLPNSEDITIK